MADYTELNPDIGEIPDYLANEDLRKVINIGLHDLMRHVDNYQLDSHVIFDLTVNDLVGTTRDVRCETSFQSSDDEVHKALIRRTVVEPDRQSDIVLLDTQFEE